MLFGFKFESLFVFVLHLLSQPAFHLEFCTLGDGCVCIAIGVSVSFVPIALQFITTMYSISIPDMPNNACTFPGTAKNVNFLVCYYVLSYFICNGIMFPSLHVSILYGNVITTLINDVFRFAVIMEQLALKLMELIFTIPM